MLEIMSSSLELIEGSLEAGGNASVDLIDSERLDSGVTNETTDQEELTAEEVLNRLQDAWINEKFAPELLEPQIEVVDCLLDQLSSAEDTLKEAKSTDKMAYTLHKMEMARVRFLVSSYLRTRLNKIQKHVFHILEEANHGKLTKEELKFAQNYKTNLDTLFKELALKHLPGKAAEFNPVQAKKSSAPVPHPNLNANVFVQAVRDVRGVVVVDEAERERDEEYDMETGSIHVLNYKCISSYLKKGDVKLM